MNERNLAHIISGLNKYLPLIKNNVEKSNFLHSEILLNLL